MSVVKTVDYTKKKKTEKMEQKNMWNNNGW